MGRNRGRKNMAIFFIIRATRNDRLIIFYPCISEMRPEFTHKMRGLFWCFVEFVFQSSYRFSNDVI